MSSQLGTFRSSIRCLRAFRFPMLAVVTCLLLTGCGDGVQKGLVAGTLMLQGKPVSQGSVAFFREPGVPAGMGNLNAAGEFQVGEPLPVGTYLVAFHFDDGEVAGAPEAGQAAAKPKVPAKYWSESTSGLTVIVEPGDNRFPLEMQ
ncbi:MAG: hypothetical protein U1E05_00795 [Patescibacteria group bacterium]|nr:hypothetical protein [Patescibacteria group bacterium]